MIILGAGSTGTVLAGRTAGHGLSTAIVEPHLVGGECSYYACMPSKALLRPAEALEETERVAGAREALRSDPAVDAQATFDRRDEVTHEGDDSGQVEWLEKNDIVLHRGEGALDGERTVRVGDDVLTARRAVVLAAGTTAKIPPIDGLREAEPWTNREATWAKQAPDSLIVLGGGNVGAELSQAFATLGSKVTLIEGSERILGREEEFASEQITEAHRERGIDVRLGARAERVTRADGGEVTVELEGGDSVSADQILVAIGRDPNSSGIGLGSVGVEDLEGGFVEVDDQLRVRGSEWLYCAGDLNGRSLLTHMGKHQARLLGDIIAGREGIEVREDLVGSPQVTFTDPQVASVGLKEFEASERGLNFRVVDQVTSMTAGASFHGKDTGGTTRIIVDEDRKVIVGATFVGTEVGEWLHAATIAIQGEVPLATLWRSVVAYPTRSEIWLKLLEEYGL
ncbi:NAD(P)/FAD-dependent oxidoreductase [Thermoleophilia bacterium SCSIO 60948]|nr:NAD(P)/FAD-dependent oxidoreductase [Thermoleophilia bacterium SCSIO 60948]